MPKFWVVLVTVLCLLAGVVTSCSAATKTYTDSAKTIDVSVDDEFLIALDSNPTTGYSWQADFDTSRVSLESDEYKADDKTAENMVGAGGTQYLKFKALQSGSGDNYLPLPPFLGAAFG